MTISVIIPVYNRAVLIQRALMSVLKQSTPPTEIIIVDDGSSDETMESVGHIMKTHPNYSHKTLY